MMEAWFGTRHPAEGKVCPTCGARVGKPCTFSTRTLGAGVEATNVPMTGMHLARLEEVRAQ